MANCYVIDSSFLLSWLLPDEALLDKYKKIVNEFKKHTSIFISCELLKYEIGNSLKSAVIRKRITAKEAKDILTVFENMYIEYRDTDKEEILNISIKNNLSFYDASYLYLAKANKCRLLTLDTALSKMIQ